MKSILSFLSSVKLAITLIIIIVVVSVLGTLLPQQRTAVEYAARYGGLATLLLRLQVTNLYHSASYIALLSLLALNTIVCSLTRLTPKLRKTFKPRLEAEANGLLAVKESGRVKRDMNLVDMAARSRKALTGRGYKVREKAEADRLVLLGRKKTLGWFGSDFVHLGLLTILAGAILSSLTGSRVFLTLKKGLPREIPQAGYQVRLDKFETEFYPDGRTVKAWKSTLTVIEGGRDIRTAVIEVNHPLAYKDFVLYQNSYVADTKSPLLKLEVRQATQKDVRSAVLQPGQTAVLGQGGLTLSLLRFEPDFVMDESRQASSRSRELNNPAAQVELRRGQEKLLEGWIFAGYPDFSMTHGSRTSEFTVVLSDIQQGISPDYSVIEAARDKGVFLIWVGCGLLMAGLLLAFYWPTREIRMLLEVRKGQAEVTAAAIGSKGREALALEFNSLLNELRSGI